MVEEDCDAKVMADESTGESWLAPLAVLAFLVLLGWAFNS